MSYRNFFILLALVGSILFVKNAFAESIYIAEPKHNNLDGEAKAFSQLLKTSLTDSGDHSIASNKESADLIFNSSILEVGDSYILTLTKISKDKTAYSKRTKIDQIEDLDIGVDRLCAAVLNDSNPGDEVKVGEITNRDTYRLQQRRESKGRWMVGFGPAYAIGFDAGSDSMFNYSLGYSWELEESMIKAHFVGSSATNESEGSLSGMGIGYSYLLSPTDTTQIINAELIWGSAQVETNELEETLNYGIYESDYKYKVESKNGFSLGLGYGLLMMRTSNVALETSIFAHQFLGTVDGKNPSTVGARVTLYF